MVRAIANRHNVFGTELGMAVAEDWRRRQAAGKFFLLKVSFVPDHVHLAVRIHPAVVPLELVANPMNAAPERMLRDFPEHLI